MRARSALPALLLVAALATAVGVAQAPAQGILLETIKISNADPAPGETETELDPDERYTLVVTGAVNDWTADPKGVVNGEKWGVDALYCYAKWRCPSRELWRQLRINDAGLDELAGKAGKIPYSPSHTYRVTITGVSGKLRFGNGDAGSIGDNSGSWTVRLYGAAGGPRGVEFTFRAYANNVRGLPRWQLGVSNFRGSGRLLRGSPPSGILITDRDDLTYYNVESITAEVTAWRLSRSGDVATLTLTVEVVGSNRRDHCPLGTVGEVTLVDADALLPNRKTSDSFTSAFPLPGGPQTAPDGGAACRTHVHGVNNADNPNTEPPLGGPGGGQWVKVEIG